MREHDMTLGEVGRICTEIKADVKALDTQVGDISERLAVLEAGGHSGTKLGLTTGALGAGVAMVGEWLWNKLGNHGP
jgi:hypothetical protein